MLKYVVILLDDTSTSFCYADNPRYNPGLMSLDTLKEAIFWAMMENLQVQFVYPDYEIPREYAHLIETIDHIDIKHHNIADVIVFNGFEETRCFNIESKNIVLRCCFNEIINGKPLLLNLMTRVQHISVIIKDIPTLNDKDFERYNIFLKELCQDVEFLVVNDHIPSVNILTDRLVLDTMNNCNSGWETITLAPNGKFYVCPAFYYENKEFSVGNLQDGIVIMNPQLYKLDYAPLCRHCDAYQCHRCVWLNRKTTREVNIPSRQQCIMAHLERNATKNLLKNIRKYGEYIPEFEIEDIDYLDPFDNLKNKL